MLRNHIKLLWNSWSYSSTLAYLVDANNGRSSTAVALNSAFRGVFAFVATEITVPLQVRTEFWVLYIIFLIQVIPLLGCCRRWYALFFFWSRLERKKKKGLIADFFFNFFFFFCIGWLYTIWAGLVLLSGSLVMFVWWKGGQWREAAETREAEHAKMFWFGSQLLITVCVFPCSRG